MNKTLHVCFDLGSDSLKTAFAYKQGTKVVYGKLTGEGDGDAALPAIAFYDAMEKKWLYADQIGKQQVSSFLTLVKIKTLIKFLQKTVGADVLKKNVDYYKNRDVFPKFYFPIKKKMLSDLSRMEENGMTFVAPGFTPASVCEGFFRYVKKCVEDSISRLENKTGNKFDDLTLTVVYPFNSGAEYINELKRLIKETFSLPVNLGLSSPKALSLFAFHRKSLKNGDKILVFDMGEEQVSVVKASYDSKGLALDCVDGHSPSLDVGGNDIDEAVAEYIEDKIGQRETMGTPSFGEEGHLVETGLYAMQYQFLREIKCAKKYLGSETDGDYWDKKGVPISLRRDLMIQKRLKKDEFLECTGIKGDKGVAAEIADYILKELKLNINADVNRVFLSGGLVETCGLLEYLSKKIIKLKGNIEVCTFDDYEKEADGYTILSHEDSTYAPSAGGAIVSLCGYKTDTVFSVSYATWVYSKEHQEWGKVLTIFAERGDRVETDSKGCCRVMCKSTPIGKEKGQGVIPEIKYDMIFSVNVTSEEIKYKKGLMKNWEKECSYFYRETNSNNRYVQIGMEDYEFPDKTSGRDFRLARKKAKEILGLRILSGGKDSAIRFYCRLNGARKRVAIEEGYVYFSEGISIDADGKATPVIVNDEKKNGTAMLRVCDMDNKVSEYAKHKTIYAKELEFEFMNLDGFDAIQD